MSHQWTAHQTFSAQFPIVSDDAPAVYPQLQLVTRRITLEKIGLWNRREKTVLTTLLAHWRLYIWWAQHGQRQGRLVSYWAWPRDERGLLQGSPSWYLQRYYYDPQSALDALPDIAMEIAL